ncbi:MAG: fasciclin domain-containing protein [Candidatus Pedobacter colombiensis]|uniref:Fasciclin domain-containing protein n=1 Tax=Candidatus Pedobacter colombiensis TaxID=3121371 RepID=A0AAJ6B780_9SPHI|nr:fasciclin domain-containing protein [Pedobacter sp.]WEK19965.1 MAG: fasciclin domain-containing protein [Pedobacter sp.]
MKPVHKNKSLKLLSICLLLLLFSCKSKFDQHYDIPDNIKGNIYEQLQANADYSEFVAMLQKTNYDQVLKLNKQYTVFAPKNGSFSSVDLNDIEKLKQLIAMHIVYSPIYQSAMDSNYVKTVNNKYLNISTLNGKRFVNGIKLGGFELKAANGVIYGIEGPILPLQNLYEVIASNPDYSLFKGYINQANGRVFDKANSTKIGVDSLARPIYDSIFVNQNYYLSSALINDESRLSTVFIPTNTLVKKLISTTLLASVGNDPSKITHADSINFYTNLFKHVVVSGKAYTSAQLAGIPSLRSVLGTSYVVNASQFQKVDQQASNGIYYELKDITAPEFLFQKSYKITARNVDTLNLVTLEGTTISSRATPVSGTYAAQVMKLNFVKVGNAASFKIPKVAPGYYNVVLNVAIDANSGLFNVAYNNQVFNAVEINASDMQPLVKQNMLIGKIRVLAFGDVQLRFICTGSSTRTAGKFELNMDQIVLSPIIAP